MSENPELPALTVNNPWPLSADRNPYLHNIFVLLEINPDKPQKEYDRTLDEANKKISSGVEWKVHGYDVSALDTSRGEQLEKLGPDFVGERLLAHTTHEVDIKEFQAALKEIDAITIPKPESLLPLPVRDLTEIARRLPQQPEELVGAAQSFPRERLLELFRPSPHEEQIFDL